MFLDNFLTVLTQVSILFLLIFIGAVANKTKLLSVEANKKISDVVVTIVAPSVIISSFLSSAKGSQSEILALLKNIGIFALIAAASHAVMIGLGILIFRPSDESKRKVLKFGTVFSNCGFMALPLIQSLIDAPGGTKTGSLYAAVYIAVFNVTMWTYGYALMSGEKKLSPEKIFLNPGIIAVGIGLIIMSVPILGGNLNAVPVRLSTVIEGVLNSVSALNVPLPMFVIGYGIISADFKSGFKDLWTYVSIALRLIVYPLIAMGALYLFGVRGEMLIVAVTCIAAPVGATTSMFSTKFSLDEALSVRLVTISTLLSIVTMPLIVALAKTIA